MPSSHLGAALRSALLIVATLAILSPAALSPVLAQEASAPTNDPTTSPREAPTTGQTASLGGSGATGPDSVGTLPQRDTGFDRKTWRDTPFETVLQLLEALPDRMDSAAQHEFARNLLLSVADVPPGDDGGTKMLLRRVQKLLAMGNVADAAALARAVPGLPEDEALAHAEIEAELLAGQVEAACIDLRAVAPVISEPEFQTGLLLCRSAAGEKIEGDVPAPDVNEIGPLARIVGAPLAADPASAPPARLVAAAQDQKLAPELRLEAAYAAGRASALYGRTVASIFRATPGAAPDDSAPATAAPASGAAAATLFHAIERTGDPAQKIALSETGLFSPDGVLDKVGVAMTTPLTGLQPSPDLAPLAARIAAIFYGISDFDSAAPWADLAVQNGHAAALWPYRVLMRQAEAVDIADWEQQSGLDAPHIARILIILSAFEITAPPPQSTAIAGEDRPDPPITAMLAMDASAKDLRVGETALRALAILGRDGPARAHPLALRRVLADLDRSQMHDEARALAFEAITATLLGR